MKNYLEQKLLRLGYPVRIAKETAHDHNIQRKEYITDIILRTKELRKT
jgi:hypothetical protein